MAALTAGHQAKGQPQRTCVGCRRRDDRARLLRVVAGAPTPAGVTIVPDPEARATGRGAWLHAVHECLDLAIKRRAFGRALRVQGATDPSAVERLIASTSE